MKPFQRFVAGTGWLPLFAIVGFVHLWATVDAFSFWGVFGATAVMTFPLFGEVAIAWKIWRVSGVAMNTMTIWLLIAFFSFPALIGAGLVLVGLSAGAQRLLLGLANERPVSFFARSLGRYGRWLVVALLLLAAFVWPTPFRTIAVQDHPAGSPILKIVQNRLTGTLYARTVDGWHEAYERTP